MKKWIATATAAVLMGSLVLTGCSKDTGGSTGALTPDTTTPVTLTFYWWGNDDRAGRYKQALDLFKEKYPNITVQTSFSDFSPYWEARATEAAGKTLPDVFQFDSAYLREYSQYGHLLDLKPYIDNKVIDLSGYEDSLVAGGNVNGVQVAIPTSTNTLAMFLNPDVIKASGVTFPSDGYTWADLNTFIQKVSDANVKTADDYKIYGSGDYTGTFWFFLQWLIQQGTEPFSADGKLNFDEAKVVQFLNLTKDLRAGKATYPTDRALSLTPKGGFTVNEAGSEMSWDNFLAGYSADSGKTNLQITPIPSGPAGTSNFFRPSMHLASGANTKHPAEAALLINFLLTDPQVGKIFGTSKGVPGDKNQRAAIDAASGSVDAQVIAYEEKIAATKTVAAPIPVKGFGTIEAKWKSLSEEIGLGTLSPEDFAKQWFSEVNQTI